MKRSENQIHYQLCWDISGQKRLSLKLFSHGGREYQPKGIPYWVYDMMRNQGWVSVGTDHGTAQFAVHTISEWWFQMGRLAYPDAKELLITADGGGSNGSRNRLWKMELQRFTNKTQLSVAVCHFPPGTSKWNKTEHRMFSYITKNWRGRPLTSHEASVNLNRKILRPIPD